MRPMFVILATLFFFLHLADCIDLETCNGALGMETGAIADTDISASSSFDETSVGPQNARIRTHREGGAWCPLNQIKPDEKEWLQVDLRRPTVVVGVETQGRYARGDGAEYPPQYYLEYWRHGLPHWVAYRDDKGGELIEGNTNTNTAVYRSLVGSIVATKIRIVPYSSFIRTICIRLELYGCPYTDHISRYTIPQGSAWAQGNGVLLNLQDQSYDGVGRGAILTGGLGKLVDGLVGENKAHSIPERWMGWKRSVVGNSIDMKLVLDEVRNVSAVSFHCNNQFKIESEVFKRAQLFFSLDGRNYDRTMVDFTYVPDTLFETARWIRIPVPHRATRVIKIRLHFAADWLLLSEVSFVSTTVLDAKGLTVALAVDDYQWATYPDQELDGISSQVDFLGAGSKNGKRGATKSLTVFTLHDSATKHLAFAVVGILVITLICALFLAVLFVRYRRVTKSAAVVYAAAYGDDCRARRSLLSSKHKASAAGAVSSDSLRDVRLYVEPTGTSVSRPAGHKLVMGNCQSLSTSSVTVNDCNSQNKLLVKLPRSPPPRRPHFGSGSMTISNPHVSSYRNPLGVRSESLSGEETSEYADPDTACFSGVTSCTDLATLPPLECAHQLHQQSVTEENNYTEQQPTLYYACSKLYSRFGRDSRMADTETNSQNIDSELPRIPAEWLHFREKLGEGQFGEVNVCSIRPSTSADSNSDGGVVQLVAVKSIRRHADEQAKHDFAKELSVMARLRHPNIVRVLGVVAGDDDADPVSVILEYMANGDLNQYLKANRRHLCYEQLIHMASQIATGMDYLESEGCVHRDLATRNCLVGSSDTNYCIKISDFGMARSLYHSDYYRIEGSFVLPIRWMAWECLLLGKFTSKTDVWAFGVTLWEMLSLSDVQPFENLTDDQVVDNLQHMYHNGVLRVYLPQPGRCSEELYDLILQCWRKDDVERPNFKEIHRFLQKIPT